MDIAAKRYYTIAHNIEEEITAETDETKKKELRKVAAQNYFYAGIEAIESVLKKSGVSLYFITDHRERLRLLQQNSRNFKDPVTIVLKYELMINYDYRRKVAYKGENGNKFIAVREFAQSCLKELP
ncbi:hypothetical protein HZB01_02520 [Candidatus Woesearchaeota archaeon]|nr:hypothetical protein [Candidatus Woesearchaeota archaeon]